MLTYTKIQTKKGNAYKIYSKNPDKFMRKLELLIVSGGEITSPNFYDDVVDYWNTLRSLNKGPEAIVALNKAEPKYSKETDDNNQYPLQRDKEGKIDYTNRFGQMNASASEFAAATKTHTFTSNYSLQKISKLRDVLLDVLQASKSNDSYGLHYNSTTNTFIVNYSDSDYTLKTNRVQTFVKEGNELLTELYDNGYIDTLLKFYKADPTKFPKILKNQLDSIVAGVRLNLRTVATFDDDGEETTQGVIDTNYQFKNKVGSSNEEQVTKAVLHLLSVAYGIYTSENEVQPAILRGPNGEDVQLSQTYIDARIQQFEKYLSGNINKIKNNDEEVIGGIISEIGARSTLFSNFGESKFGKLNKILLSLYSMMDGREYYRVGSITDWRKDSYTLKSDAKPLYLIREDKGTGNAGAKYNDGFNKNANSAAMQAGYNSYEDLLNAYDKNPTRQIKDVVDSVKNMANKTTNAAYKSEEDMAYTLYPVFDERDVISIRKETKGQTAFMVARGGDIKMPTDQPKTIKRIKDALDFVRNSRMENKPAKLYFNYINAIAETFGDESTMLPSDISYDEIIKEVRAKLNVVVKGIMDRDFRSTPKGNTAKEKAYADMSAVNNVDSLIENRAKFVTEMLMNAYGLPSKGNYDLIKYVDTLPTQYFRFAEVKEVLPSLVRTISSKLSNLKISATKEKNKISTPLNEMYDKLTRIGFRLNEDVTGGDMIPVPDESKLTPEYISDFIEKLMAQPKEDDGVFESTSKLFEAIIKVL